MKTMQGKKFVLIFIATIIFVGGFVSVLIRQAYETRPQIPVESSPDAQSH